MTWQISRSLRASLIYGIGILAQHGVGAILLPIYTHWLSTADYGILEILSRTRDVFVLTAGSAIAITTIAFHQLPEFSDRPQRVVLAALLLQSLACLLIGVPVVLGARPIAQHLLGLPDGSFFVVCVTGIFFFDAIHQVVLAAWQARLRATLFVTFQAAMPVVRAGWIVLYLTVRNLGVRGVIVAWLFNSALFAAVVLAILARQLRPWPGWPSRRLLSSMVRYAWPFIPNSIFGFVLSSGDRYFLAALKGMAATGIYGLGYRVAVLYWSLLFVPFQKTWTASMIRLAQDEPGRARLARITDAYLALLGVGLFSFAVFGRHVLRLLVPSSYDGAWNIVPVILLAQYFQALVALLDASLYATRSTRTKAAITGIGALVILALYAATIPRWGTTGAAWSTAAAYGLLAILTDRIGRRRLRIPISRRTTYGLPVAAAVVFTLATAMTGGDQLERLPHGTLAIALFLALAVAGGCIRPREIRAVVTEHLGGGGSGGEAP